MSNLDGQTLGKYQMIERLGRGGMADVYKAYQPGLDRYVAIKVLHPHLAEDKDFITRFQREAKSVAKLRHPNIMQVYDFDSQGEHYFMVMEFVEGGQSLKEYLQGLNQRGERVSLAASAGLAAKLADALDYAHNEGMVHRDIKPANVLLPSIDKPLLGDFGIARIIGQTGLTAEGAMIGTPAYMSPEQGRGEPADERSDIYALGIILYELITNQPPYDADTPYGVILKHMNDPLISPREFVGDVPESLERVVLKSLAKNPADRYDTAGAMRDALNASLGELGSATQQSVSTTPLKKGGTGATQVSPANAGETQYASGKRPTDEAMTQQVASPADQSAPRKGVPVLVWALIGIVALVLVGGGLVVSGVLGFLTLGAPSGGPSAPVVEGQAPPNSQSVSGLSEADQQRALEGFELISTWDPGDSIPIFQELATSYPDNPDMNAALAMGLMQDSRMDEALPILTSLELGSVDTQIVNLALGMSYYWRDEGDFEKAMSYISKSIDQCDGNVHLCVYALQERTWMQWYDDRNFDLAYADMSRAVELTTNNSHKAALLDSRADLLESAGDFDGAISDMEQAFELENREAPWYLQEAARLAVISGHLDRAQQFYAVMREKDPGNPNLLADEAYIKYLSGDFEKANELVNLAIERDPNINQPHYLLALMAYDAGDYDGALAEFQVILDSEYPDDYSWPFYGTESGHQITYDRARATLEKGDVDGALALIEQTLEEESWWPQPLVLRAQIYKDRGEIEKARIDLTQALDIARDWNRQDWIDWIQGELDNLD